MTASIRRSEAGLDGMANTCEPLLNAVIVSKPKMLCSRAEGLDQKVRGVERVVVSSPVVANIATGKETEPKPSVRHVCGTW